MPVTWVVFSVLYLYDFLTSYSKVENRIPNLILHGEILQGQRKQGKPKKSFREGLKNDLHKFDLFGKYSEKNTFRDFVADRDNWRKMINKQAQFFQNNR